MVRYASNSFTLSFCAGGTYGKSAHFVMRDPGRKREEERENFLFPSSAATETIGELSERKTFLSLVKGSLYFLPLLIGTFALHGIATLRGSTF